MQCPKCQHEMIESRNGLLCLNCGHIEPNAHTKPLTPADIKPVPEKPVAEDMPKMTPPGRENNPAVPKPDEDDKPKVEDAPQPADSKAEAKPDENAAVDAEEAPKAEPEPEAKPDTEPVPQAKAAKDPEPTLEEVIKDDAPAQPAKVEPVSEP